MKRYLLFAGWRYEPAGGFQDYVGSFASEQEAKNHPCDKAWREVVYIEDTGNLTQICGWSRDSGWHRVKDGLIVQDT